MTLLRWARPGFLLLFVLAASSGRAATINNDDSCDVTVLPAATLLLPYFEVDLDNMAGETTLFTLTNVTNADRIARVTLWTDRAYPVLAFNIYLTGYDVQAVNLFDVIARGIIAPEQGTGTQVSDRGDYSHPNQEIDLTGCTRLPGLIDSHYVTRMKSAFLTGVIPGLGNTPICREAGGVHANAIGYATIDVVRTCSPHLPHEPLYWTEDIAFENVLTGDYQQVNSTNNFAQGNPMVHIRAIPEGGTPAQRRAQPAAFDAGFPRTFYGRYQTASEPRFDGRQPLPSTFASRWIQGGTGGFQTSLKIWREGGTGAGSACESYQAEGALTPVETVRFDEAENGAGDFVDTRVGFPVEPPQFPSSSRTRLDDERFPQLANNPVAGWIYLNLDSCGWHGGVACTDQTASQNWVVTSMRAQGRFSTDVDATALGNGCSAAASVSEVNRDG
ncbi:MAG: hypothetical protein ABI779_00560, partial [Acidobacteriota bacterium]